MRIKIFLASVGHPESNRAVERANNDLLQGLTKRLVGMPKGLRPEELIKALWGIRTSLTRATGFSPFRLLFNDEAMTPGELTVHAFRAQAEQVPAERWVSLTSSKKAGCRSS